MTRYSNQTPFARFKVEGGILALESSYDADVVADMKAQIPAAGRAWDKASKRWLIDPQHGPLLAQIVERRMGITMTVPQVSSVPKVETKMVQVDYLGQCKPENGGMARGLTGGTVKNLIFGDYYEGGSWNLFFPEAVLRAWFNAGPDVLADKPATPARPAAPPKPQTDYEILGLKRACDQDEIKPAYRRMAMHVHPDRNKEPNAAEQFLRVQAAYDRLSDPLKRRKYDVGLIYQIDQEKKADHNAEHARKRQAMQNSLHNSLFAGQSGYRSPVRCGLLLVEGTQQAAGFAVSKILAWQDIVNAQGKTMISSWDSTFERIAICWA